MKNKTATIIGFLLGAGGFLLLFKVLFLDRIPPSDELAPGIVVFLAFLNGLLFAATGYFLQNSFRKKEMLP
jgi:hypothetical protein